MQARASLAETSAGPSPQNPLSLAPTISKMAIMIRDADEGDVDLLVSLNQVVQDLHVAALPAYFKHPDPSALAQSFRMKLSQADTRIWIAFVDGVAAGHAVAIFRERPENALCLARTFCELDEMAVAQAYRRCGVARALLERVLDLARSRGVLDIELSSWSFNTDAHAAFEALGFLPKVMRFGRQSC